MFEKIKQAYQLVFDGITVRVDNKEFGFKVYKCGDIIRIDIKA